MNKLLSIANNRKMYLTIMYSIIYTLGITLFLNSANLISTGLSGVAQILDNILNNVNIPVTYGTLYLALNIPGILLGWFKIGKKFTFYSIISIFTVTLTSDLFPVIHVTDDIILNSIFGGLLMGYAIGGLLKIGASSGGTDFYGIWLFEKYGIDFTRINVIINFGIIGVATFIYGIEIGLYTLLSFYVRTVSIDQVFTNNNKITVWIIGQDLTKVSQYINQKLKHGTTIIPNVEGGYTRERKEIIMTILNQYEYSMLIEDLYKIDPTVFINVTETYKLHGNFKFRKEEDN